MGAASTSPNFRIERARLKAGARIVCGVDEVGRGPLAGPVGVAAVILDPKRIPKGLDNSKALTAARREELNEDILATAISIALVFAPASEIDTHNIRGATLRAMARAVAALSVRPDYALIDGRDVPPGLVCSAEAVIGGDARSVSIAAASIVAKVARDRLMTRLDAHYPGYGFAQHAGYATAVHRAALLQLGPCALHRRSFTLKPIQADLFEAD